MLMINFKVTYDMLKAELAKKNAFFDYLRTFSDMFSSAF